MNGVNDLAREVVRTAFVIAEERAAKAAIIAERDRWRAWAESELTRTGDGSYGKGQRVVLHRLLERLSTDVR